MPPGPRPAQTEDGRTATPAKPSGERRSDRLSVATLVTLVGAILAAFISGTNLTFELWPSLKPDPKVKVSADLQVLEMDKNVNYGDYDARPGRNVSTAPDETELRNDFPGNVFYLRAHIEGFKRESLRLIWFTYHKKTRDRSEEDEARSDRIFEPGSPTDTQVAQVWVKEPGHFDEFGWESTTGTYFVRFELYRGDVLLAFEDSPQFTVR